MDNFLTFNNVFEPCFLVEPLGKVQTSKYFQERFSKIAFYDDPYYCISFPYSHDTKLLENNRHVITQKQASDRERKSCISNNKAILLIEEKSYGCTYTLSLPFINRKNHQYQKTLIKARETVFLKNNVTNDYQDNIPITVIEYLISNHLNSIIITSTSRSVKKGLNMLHLMTNSKNFFDIKETDKSGYHVYEPAITECTKYLIIPIGKMGQLFESDTIDIKRYFYFIMHLFTYYTLNYSYLMLQQALFLLNVNSSLKLSG